MDLHEFTSYLDRYLDIHAFSDAALNGLQVENSCEVAKVGLSVDACLEAILKAAEKGCNLLLVHHGLFWGGSVPIRGHIYRRIRALVHADMALYAVHLPLDAHPEVGNNAQISRRLNLEETTPFGSYEGALIGVQGSLPGPVSMEEAVNTCRDAVGRERILFRFGPKTVSRVAIVSGSASDPALLEEASRNRIDLFITGEPKQAAYSLAQELGLNVFYGGHYRTETYGLKALGTHLTEQIGLPVEFIEVACPL